MARKKKEATATKSNPLKPGAKQQARTALERLENLEQTVLPKLFSDLQDAFNNIDTNFRSLREEVDALVRVVGKEKVQAEIVAIQAEEDKVQRDQQASQVEDFVSQGALVAAETVGEHAFIVGREFDKEGTLLRPGRVQLALRSIKAQFQEALKGQAAGFTFETESGGKFEVLEVYDIQAPKAPAVAETVAE